MRLILCPLIIAVIASSVSAQESSDGGDAAAAAAEARHLFVEGTTALQAGELHQAEALLLLSMKRSHNPAAAYNLARVYEEQARPHRALELLRAMADGSFGRLDDDQYQAVRGKLETLRGKVGTVALSGVMLGDVVHATDREPHVVRTNAGSVELLLAPGSVLLRRERAGAPPSTCNLEIAAAETATCSFDAGPVVQVVESPEEGTTANAVQPATQTPEHADLHGDIVRVSIDAGARLPGSLDLLATLAFGFELALSNDLQLAAGLALATHPADSIVVLEPEVWLRARVRLAGSDGAQLRLVVGPSLAYNAFSLSEDAVGSGEKLIARLDAGGAIDLPGGFSVHLLGHWQITPMRVRIDQDEVFAERSFGGSATVGWRFGL